MSHSVLKIWPPTILFALKVLWYYYFKDWICFLQKAAAFIYINQPKTNSDVELDNILEDINDPLVLPGLVPKIGCC